MSENAFEQSSHNYQQSTLSPPNVQLPLQGILFGIQFASSFSTIMLVLAFVHHPPGTLIAAYTTSTKSIDDDDEGFSVAKKSPLRWLC